MKRILVTQRVVVEAARRERCDALDVRWYALFERCDVVPLLVPNDRAAATRLLELCPADGLLLTGGNTLAAYGGDAPERDEVERALLRHAFAAHLPVLGVCRGMQLVQSELGVPLTRVAGHVRPRQTIRVDGVPAEVNSYHEWGARESVAELEVWARADDGVVKAVRHVELPVVGIMWHPERIDPLREDDVALFSSVFRCAH